MDGVWPYGRQLGRMCFYSGVSRPAHDLVEPAHGRVGMADLPLPSRADWPMGTLRKDPALALAGLGVGKGEWRSPMCGSDTCTQSAVPGVPRSRSARRRPAHHAHSSRPAPGHSIQLPSWPPRTSASRHPRTRRPESWGRQTHPQPNAGAAPLARSPSVRRPAGRVLERRRDAPRCVASHRDCTASARLGSSSPGSGRSGRDTPHGRWRDRASEQSIAASRDVNAARRPSVSTQGSIEM